MVELIRTNDPVLLSWLEARLREDRIQIQVMDVHTSVLEGSAGAIPRRVMVAEGDYSRARWVLYEAERLAAGKTPGNTT